MADYNGWKNWETWNVALWLSNDEGLYGLCKGVFKYSEVAELLNEMGMSKTPDGVSYTDPKLDIKALDEMLEEA